MASNKPNKNSKGKKFLLAFIPVVVIAGIAVVVAALFFFRDAKPVTQSGADRNFKTLSEKFTDVEITDEASALQATKAGALIMGLEGAAEELSLKSFNETDDLCYYRFQQNYKGYPVFGKAFVLVAKGTEAVDITTNCFELGKVDLETKISDEDAETSIKNKLTQITGASDFEYFESEKLSDDKLWIYCLGDNTARLAYRIYTTTDYGYYVSFVASATGEILYCDNAASGVQQSFTYSGQKELHTFQAEAGEDYNEMIYESDTGTKIIVHSPSEENEYEWVWQCDRGKTDVDVVSWRKATDPGKGAGLDLEPDPSAVDAMYNISKAYNYYKDYFGRKSLSGKSKDIINVYIHVNGHWVRRDHKTDEEGNDKEADYDNAKFAPTPNTHLPLICIGNHFKRFDGKIVYDSQGELLTTTDFGSELDIMAHEYTHGVICYTCGLCNTDDNHMPSAINEAIADIMGNCIEGDVEGKKIDWVIDIPELAYRTAIKDNPNRKWYSSPAAYHVDDYEEGNEEKYEEHYASTIISYAAYLMSTDGGGKLSNKEIPQLWYHTILTLPSDCTFHELANHVMLAAKDLKFSESKIDAIIEAFDTVGIKVEKTYSPDIDLQVVDAKYQLYDDYVIEISGSYVTGWLIKQTKEFSETINVKTSEPQHLKLKSNGEYVVTIYDKKDRSKRYSKSISVEKDGLVNDMYYFTNFGDEMPYDADDDESLGIHAHANIEVEVITCEDREEQFTKYLEDVLIPEKGIADQTQKYVSKSGMAAYEYFVYSYEYDSKSDEIVCEMKRVSLQGGGHTREQMEEEAKAYEEMIDSYSYNGIISVDLHDYDGDGEMEMLVLTGYDFVDQYEWKRHGCNAEFYDVNEKGEIELYEEFNVSMYEGENESSPYEISREDIDGYGYGFIVAQMNYAFDLDHVMETTVISSNATMKKTLKYHSYVEDYSITEWESMNVGKEGNLIDSGRVRSDEETLEQVENYESLLREKGYVNDTLVKLCSLRNGMLDYTGFSKKYCFGISR